VEAVVCKLGRVQLRELAGRADALAGVSEFNAGELREVSGRDAAVIPVLFDPTRLGPSGPAERAGPPTVLFVGRLAPHKRQDLIIRAFARFRRRHRPDARLALVGTPLSPSYRRELEQLAEGLAPGAVTFESGLSSQELAQRYRSAHVLLCLSEHEGFCIPLLEAFHFGLPVVARNAAAVGEVVGDAGVLLDHEDGLATVAELLELVVGDQELQAELRVRGQARLDHFDPARTAQEMRSTLTALAGGA
jgi:glycosyltransferase involved in cell wall biosynthesis